MLTTPGPVRSTMSAKSGRPATAAVGAAAAAFRPASEGDSTNTEALSNDDRRSFFAGIIMCILILFGFVFYRIGNLPYRRAGHFAHHREPVVALTTPDNIHGALLHGTLGAALRTWLNEHRDRRQAV